MLIFCEKNVNLQAINIKKEEEREQIVRRTYWSWSSFFVPVKNKRNTKGYYWRIDWIQIIRMEQELQQELKNFSEEIFTYFEIYVGTRFNIMPIGKQPRLVHSLCSSPSHIALPRYWFNFVRLTSSSLSVIRLVIIMKHFMVLDFANVYKSSV